MTSSDELRIGISGWRYACWREKLYPKDLPQRPLLDLTVLSGKAAEID